MKRRSPSASILGALLAFVLAATCTQERLPAGQCEFDSNCPTGQRCVDRYCRPECRTDTDCGAGARCVAADTTGILACRPTTQTSAACMRDSDCPAGQACFDGHCLAQCRADYDCQVINPLSRCNEGHCERVCPTAHDDCDRIATNGCEADLRVNNANCGACGRACPASANGSPVCRNMRCDVVCNTAFGDCDTAPSNGCEAPLMTDRGNCGACGRACPEGQVCTGGRCDLRCMAPGEILCGASCVNAQTDLANCGACGMACPAPAHGTATCATGRCGVTCDRGFGDCDMSAANGCETDLSSPENCGACGTRCSGETPRCTAVDGVFMCTAEPCPGTVCSGACVNTQTDLNHCGACGNRCPSGAGSVAACEAGRCALRCTEPTRAADCDGMAANGCEATLATDTGNCGACGTRCPAAANSTGACAAGVCGLTCNAGFGNCDGMAANGCEADTRVDAFNCGRCGSACQAPANAAPGCVAGACTFTCDTGFADCDRMPTNGCEVSTNDDRANCGACGRACVAGEVCSAGTCRSTCAAGETNCSGSCARLSSNTSHCGACDRACATPANATAACAEGTCSFTCDRGFGNCDSNAANGCETSLLTTPTSCGACGSTCALANATAGCDMGRCVVASCNAGFADCDGNPTNGCEVDTRGDRSNCGACARVCAVANGTPVCASGVCAVGTCNTGFADCDRDARNGCEVDTRSNVSHCGGCGAACNSTGGTATCTAGVCGITCASGRGDCNRSVADGCETVTTSDVRNCGACGTVCAAANATPACTSGACGIATCNAGFANCDAMAANGCEVNIQTTLAHCGACARACAPANATGVCSAGTCGVAACNAGFADCNGLASDGCEVNLNTSTANCGRCGNICGASGGTATCASGACGITCAAGRGDCNRSLADGCETDLTSTVTSCGACGMACSLPNATAACASSACRVATCNTNFADCNGTASDGCEVNTQSDVAHCGACGRACPSGQVCSSGVCTLVCGTGQANCGGRCVTLASDPANCGACGTVCPPRANATVTCASSTCGFTCASGFGDCDGMAATGCETNLFSTVTHCGRCGAACSLPNATPVCAGGACAVGTCNTGFADCNGTASDGCEVDTRTTLAHCGGCGRTCAPANATGVCSAGSCGVLRCNAGFADCDGNPTNGCEVNLQTDPTNCARCGNACMPANAPATCTAGVCGHGVCAAGFGDCDGDASNGCETSTATDVANCGGCGMACSANHGSPACSGGNCGILCERTGSLDGSFYYRTFYGNCDGDARTNGCETDLLQPSNCQACGRVCSYPNAVGACSINSATQCYMASCNAGYADCNATPADGCEVNTTSDSSNCGTCGTACIRGATCRQSACRPANDTCTGATAVNLASGRQIWLYGNTTTSLHDIDPSCRATTSPDVYFSFTLTQRELVYADTFGDGTTTYPAATWDTVLLLANGCTTSMSGGPAGTVYCNDDASSLGCSGDGNRSQISAVLEPGTYYLVLSGYGGASGTAWINFQHLPMGNGTPVNIPAVVIGTNATYSGVTSGTGTLAPAATCTASGPEVSYWWRQCSAASRFSLSMSTCNTGSNYDTVLYYRNAWLTTDYCNDDAGATSCPMRSTLSILGATVPGTSGIHTITVDGYGTASMGNYVLTVGGYAIIAQNDPIRGVCRPPSPRALPPPRRVRASRDASQRAL